MRHAKSDWANNLPDIERPLNSRGKKAAPFMAEQLRKLNKIPDIIMCSPAKRAVSTAKKVIKVINYEKELLIVEDFYFGHINRIIDLIKSISNENASVLIVGHNPIWEDLIMTLINKGTYIVMPTAAIASVIFDVDDWQKISEKTGDLEWLITPKGLSNE